MGQFVCRCGDVIRTTGEIPHPYEWLLFADQAIADEGWEGPFRDLYNTIAIHAFKCPTCRRLWVFWDGVQAEPQCYTPS
jgi:hypothetical protein